MLCQDHVSAIKGFMGQTTAFREDLLKPGVTVLGENLAVKPGAFPYSEYNSKRAKYIHGTLGKGTWTFYGGHDPESYRHIVGSAPTDLNQFPNSAGYRLILDNLLVPAARKSLAQPLISPAEPVAKMIITEKEQGRSASNVKMYSDPANNELIIVIDSKSGAPDRQENRVTITDFNGGEVLNHSYSTQKINLNLKDLPAGMYQVSVNGSSLGKIMKQ